MDFHYSNEIMADANFIRFIGTLKTQNHKGKEVHKIGKIESIMEKLGYKK